MTLCQYHEEDTFMSNYSETVVCSNCGTSNTGSQFCVNCGAALSYPASQPAPQPAQYQPTYAPPVQPAPPVAPTYVEPVVQTPVAVIGNIRNYNSKWDYTPIKPWGYFGLNLLFSIPLVGLIFLLVFALGGTTRINLRNYARSYFCGLLLAVIIIILVIIFWGVIVSYLGDSFSFNWSLF